jgi:hypothetical protein
LFVGHQVRNKAAGTIGEVALYYDRVTGRFEAESSSVSSRPSSITEIEKARMEARGEEQAAVEAEAYAYPGDSSGSGGFRDSTLSKFAGE